MDYFLETIKPEFFDVFGIFVFSFIVIVSIWGLQIKRPFAKWVLITLLIIGILGFLVDGIIVFTTYFT